MLSPEIKECLKATYLVCGLGEFNLYDTWWKGGSSLNRLYAYAIEDIDTLEAHKIIIPCQPIIGYSNYKLNPDKIEEYL